MKADILQIGTYSRGSFRVEMGGKEYTCFLKKSDQWDKLYDYLMRSIDLTIVCELPDGNLIVEIND